MNNYSLNETASRARLAAKGAGYHWGQADEVYRSVFWLVQRNLPAPLMLSHLLDVYSAPSDVELSMPKICERHCSARGAVLCPVLLGCALTDRIDASGIDSVVTFEELHSPLLLLPFIAELAIKFDRVVVIEFDSINVATDGKHMRFSSSTIPQLKLVKAGTITFENREVVKFSTDEELPFHSRVSVDAAIWQALDAFAHHTYAPATEASRISGAGAGVSDND